MFLRFASTMGPKPSADPSAEDLVRRAEAAEAWVHEIKSIYARLEGTWTRTPKGLAHNRAELAKQFPGVDLDKGNFLDLCPLSQTAVCLAFDDHRLRGELHESGSHTSVQTWDGKLSTGLWQNTSDDKASYSLDKKPRAGISLMMLGAISWLRGRPHHFWWSEWPAEQDVELYGLASDWSLVGRRQFRGIDCYELNYRRQTLFIGAADILIHGYLQRHPSYSKQMLEVQNQFWREHGAPCNEGPKHSRWAMSLPEDKRKALEDELEPLLKPFLQPWVEYWMLDYREAAPGCQFPMWQGYDSYERDDEGNSLLSFTRDLRAVEVRVNEPLPDDLFTIRFKEGARVTDYRFDPSLVYKWKENMSEAEYQALVETRAQEQAPMRAADAKQDALIGQPAPPFPVESTWLNSEPLTWDNLRAQVVIIDFWAEWCGPCRNDLPTMCGLHKDREMNEIVVISVHNPGSEREAIDKVMKEFGIEYPVCIDIAEEGGPATWGKLAMKDYHVFGIPHAFVIDRAGRIAGHGSLNEAYGKAYELAGEPED